jgi:hypothetical protein
MCECGGIQFKLVGYQNSTYLVCGICEAPPFRSSQKGHLGRKPMLRSEVEAFKRRLAKAEGA